MSADSEKMKFQDPNVPLEQRVDDLVGRMTLEEKVSQMCHAAPAIERLGVPEYNWWNECLHGVGRAGKATVFPQAIGLAATFNARLIRRVATAISDEARAKHHQAIRQDNRGWYFGLTYWTPNINIFRDPRWGRGQETYGEDPFLTSRIGVAFCSGLQGDDPNCLKLVATPKHYAVHSGPESLRHSFDARVSQRDLRETYLPAFEATVREARAESVMGAYNRTNGEPCCGSKTLLQDILRDEWGFEGYVVSDCGAIADFHQHHKVTSAPSESAAMAVKNGCELNCGRVYPSLMKAVEKGLISEEEIDVAVKRLMRARLKLGMFDPEENVPYAMIPPDVVDCEEHQQLARMVAGESMVLLKNANDVLPLDKHLKNILVTGPTAYNLRMLHANYFGYSSRMSTILEGIIEAVSPGTQVHYNAGCALTGDAPVDEKELQNLAGEADVIIAAVGFTADLEGEEGEAAMEAASEGGGDRERISLPGRQEELLKVLAATGKPLVVVVTSGSPVDLSWAAENVPAILIAWYPGQEGGAVADVLFGDVNPAGRLPITFPKSLEQLPPFEDYNMAGRTYRFMEGDPLYRFGYGLSYTTFAYGELELSKEAVGPDEEIEVRAQVTNTGDRIGDEVVQLYVRDVEASVRVPRHQLRGFGRITLKPGETRTVTFKLPARQLACYADDGTPFVEPGEFEISVGGGQPDDPEAGAVTRTLSVQG